MIVGKRQRRPQRLGRSVLLSVSAIALLALACFPVLAHAECTSSSCIQYTESLPEPGNEGGSGNSHHKQNPAKASKSGDGGSSPSGSDKQEAKSESSEGESSNQGGVAGGGHEGGPPQGNAGGSSNGSSEKTTNPGGQASSAPASSKSGGGSSPLVPILIAIAVLAAISVGAVLYRQRRERRGPSASASPEAG